MARLARVDYLAAGLEILGESGSDGLTIAALCERLQVTKGSFYHHFDGMPAYNAAVLEYWEDEHNNRLIAASARSGDDPMSQVPVLTQIAVRLPHATESAIRAWGKSNPEVAEVQARVDQARATRIAEVLRSLGIDKAKADLLTDLSVSVLIGFQHTPPLETSRLQAMLDEINRLIFIEAGR